MSPAAASNAIVAAAAARGRRRPVVWVGAVMMSSDTTNGGLNGFDLTRHTVDREAKKNLANTGCGDGSSAILQR
jgi:hypothetical protein